MKTNSLKMWPPSTNSEGGLRLNVPALSLTSIRTNLERDARISGKPVSLHTLYNMVMERGGYDKLSDERMAWRQLVKPLGFSHQHEGAMTFQIKSLYYRNLA